MKNGPPPTGPKGREVRTPGFWEYIVKDFKSIFGKDSTPRHFPPPPPMAVRPMPPVKPPRGTLSQMNADRVAAEEKLRADHPGLHDLYEQYQHAKLQYEMMVKLVNTQNGNVEEIQQANTTTPGQIHFYKGFSD